MKCRVNVLFPFEMLEVQLINVTAPSLFTSQLVDLMRKSP